MTLSTKMESFSQLINYLKISLRREGSSLSESERTRPRRASLTNKRRDMRKSKAIWTRPMSIHSTTPWRTSTKMPIAATNKSKLLLTIIRNFPKTIISVIKGFWPAANSKPSPLHSRPLLAITHCNKQFKTNLSLWIWIPDLKRDPWWVSEFQEKMIIRLRGNPKLLMLAESKEET